MATNALAPSGIERWSRQPSEAAPSFKLVRIALAARSFAVVALRD